MYAVTGHHSVDYLETILINLIRGGGPESLKTLKIFENNVFRPLIKFKMSEMEEIHAGEKWEVFLDESNDDTKFLRNRIRRNIVPELLKENLSPEKLYDNFHNDEEENSVGSQTETFPFLKIDKQMIINAGAGILKQAIDIFLKRLRKHPIQKKLFMELKLSIDQGKSFTKENKECIFWKSQRSHLYIIPRNSPVLRKPILQNSSGQLSVIWNSREYSLSSPSTLGTYSNGLKILSNGIHKYVSEIFRENEIPLPVRKFIPIIFTERLPVRILLSMWDENIRDIQIVEIANPDRN